MMGMERSSQEATQNKPNMQNHFLEGRDSYKERLEIKERRIKS